MPHFRRVERISTTWRRDWGLSREWRQFVMDLDSLNAESVEAVFMQHGACSVTFSDAGDKPVLEPAPGETPFWGETRITGLFESGADLRGAGPGPEEDVSPSMSCPSTAS